MHNKQYYILSASLLTALIMGACTPGLHKKGSQDDIPKGDTVSEWDQRNEDLKEVKAHSEY